MCACKGVYVCVHVKECRCVYNLSSIEVCASRRVCVCACVSRSVILCMCMKQECVYTKHMSCKPLKGVCTSGGNCSFVDSFIGLRKDICSFTVYNSAYRELVYDAVF